MVASRVRFVTEIVRIDVAAIAVLVVVGLTDLVPAGEVFDGFASNAVISIIAVMILGAGLDRVGVMRSVAAWLLRVGGDTERRVLVSVSATVGAISAFLQNIGAAALFLPVVERVAERTGLAVSRLLMPMGFAAILGGTLTLVASGPLILLNDLLVSSAETTGRDIEPYGLFAPTPIGLVILASGIAMFALAGRWLLPAVPVGRGSAAALPDVESTYGLDRDLQPARVPADSPFSVLRDDEHAGLAEVVVRPGSEAVGRRVEDLRLRHDLGVVLLALHHRGQVITEDLRSPRLGAGDVMIVFAPWERLARATLPAVATKLILIHGRNQHGQDPGELRAHWLAGLQRGFDRLGLASPIAAEDVIFPFFGDALHELTREDSLDEAEAVIGDDLAAGDSDEEEATVRLGREVVGEVLDASGVSAATIEAEIEGEADGDAGHETVDEAEAPRARVGGALTWEWVQAGLAILDRLVPGASAASVAYAAGDVAQYLENERIHTEIDAVVAAAFEACAPDDRVVVVAHSLGSVIAYKLLAHGVLLRDRSIATFVTLGSPLGVTAIREAVSPVVHPGAVAHWLNAYDPRDVVALHPLDHRHFAVTPPILDHGAVANPSPNHHKVEGYLEDPVVALTIHEALTSGRLPPVLARRRRVSGDPATVADLTTPALVVESSVFDANCAAMDAVRPGLELRPHVKAFKSTALARRLAADGHTAFCAATPREIEGMVAAGLTEDLLLANETLDTARLGALADRARITVAVDSDATLDAAIVGGLRSVLIDVNVGLPRCGCAPADAGRLADRARAAGLEVRGVMGYEGHLMMVPDRAKRIEQVEASMAALLAAAETVGGDVISGGGTGTFDTNTWCTEIQAGSYCLLDTDYAELDLPFRIALEVLATVIAIHPDGLVIADAGLKALGMDHGNPRWAHGRVLFCSDEHVTLAPAEPGAWSVGDLIRLQPAHVDPTVARHRDLWLVDGEQIVDRWPIDLRHW